MNQNPATNRTPDDGAWPSLPLEAWRDTRETLHMWMQVVGKVRLAEAPHVNHWWQVPLYVNARGLTTSPVPHGDRIFQVDFDFVAHKLLIETNDGDSRTMQLAPRTVADFYFFFQAEDGIRDPLVTGVQTCALPISRARGARAQRHTALLPRRSDERCAIQHRLRPDGRSEERRVGKECRSRW